MYYDFKIGSGVYSIQSIAVSDGGSGYTSATISIVGGGGYGATATAVISNGSIIAIEVTNKGFSYISQPNITISGNGIGAKAGAATISSVNGSSQLTIVKDITHNIRFRKEILENITLYDEYDIRDGETPEIIAERIYGNAQYHWVIMLLNERYDYITDFPLSYPELVSHTEQKYGAGNANGIHHYLDFNGNRVDSIISSVTMLDYGSGYDSEADPPLVTIDAPTGSNPIQAYGVAILSGGGISGIAVRAGGSGYSSATCSIVGGGGSGATATVQVFGGAVTGITITNAGSGYTGQPYITIFGDGSNAYAGAASIYTSAVVGVDITSSTILGVEVINSGSGYITIPNITIAPPPSGTTATAVCSIVAYTPITNLQYEDEINESKRKIKLITPDLLNTILTNYKDLL